MVVEALRWPGLPSSHIDVGETEETEEAVEDEADEPDDEEGEGNAGSHFGCECS